MSLVLPVLYHWSPTENRAGIIRRGLRPTCPSGVFVDQRGRPTHLADDPDSGGDSIMLAICLGTSPSHAWSLSGGVFAEKGDRWDLWQVTLDEGDEVHPLPFWGYRLDEIRVANRIPKRRVWHVGERVA